MTRLSGSACLRSRLDLIELTVAIAASWIFCIVIMHSVARILSRVDASGSFRIPTMVSGINRSSSLDGASPAAWKARKTSCRSLCEFVSISAPIRPCERVERTAFRVTNQGFMITGFTVTFHRNFPLHGISGIHAGLFRVRLRESSPNNRIEHEMRFL